MRDDVWEDYSFIVRGKQRRKIISRLGTPKTPTELKKETKFSLTNVSRTLVLFEKKGLAKCLTPKEKVGRVYTLTDKGERVRKLISEREHSSKNSFD